MPPGRTVTMAAAMVAEILKLLESMTRTSPLLNYMGAGCCVVRKAKSIGEAPKAPAARR
jgi:hypothetical protein